MKRQYATPAELAELLGDTAPHWRRRGSLAMPGPAEYTPILIVKLAFGGAAAALPLGALFLVAALAEPLLEAFLLGRPGVIANAAWPMTLALLGTLVGAASAAGAIALVAFPVVPGALRVARARNPAKPRWAGPAIGGLVATLAFAPLWAVSFNSSDGLSRWFLVPLTLYTVTGVACVWVAGALAAPGDVLRDGGRLARFPLKRLFAVTTALSLAAGMMTGRLDWLTGLIALAAVSTTVQLLFAQPLRLAARNTLLLRLRRRRRARLAARST